MWVNGKQFFKVDHAANIRMGTTVSKIWHHGTEHRLAGDIRQKFWSCNHCKKVTMYSMKGGTNTLAIPATATECERTFSSAKKLVAPERNRLGDDVSKLDGITA